MIRCKPALSTHAAATLARALLLSAALAAGACQQVPMLPGLKPYRMDVQQGNVVTQDMIEKLKPGMTRQQVRFVMGTPPIADAFHQDRWDYVYYLNKGGQIVEHRRIVLLFDGDTLKRIEGDVVAAAPGGAVKPAAAPAASGTAAVARPAEGRPVEAEAGIVRERSAP